VNQDLFSWYFKVISTDIDHQVTAQRTQARLSTGSMQSVRSSVSSISLADLTGVSPEVDLNFNFLPFHKQVGAILQVLLLSGASVHFSVYKASEVIGLAIVSGCVWFQRNADPSLIGLRETVGLLFFTTAIWSIPPMFQALTSGPTLLARVRHESAKGIYTVSALVCARTIADVILQACWPVMWILVAYAFADVGQMSLP